MNPVINPVVSATKHAIGRTVSVLCVLAVVALLGLGVKRIIYPPKTESYAQTVQAGGTNNNIEYHYYPNKKVLGLGFTLWGWDIGIMKYDYPKEPIKK
jgi:hypothetical protein